MRLGNAEDAKAASEQIGTAHRFVLSQLTETVGTSVTDTLGGSYTSTVGDSASAAYLRLGQRVAVGAARRTARSAPACCRCSAAVVPLRADGHVARVRAQSASLTAGISTSTAWGLSTSRAAGDSESLARSLQRSRELVVEPSELQRLPATAMIVSYGAGDRTARAARRRQPGDRRASPSPPRPRSPMRTALAGRPRPPRWGGPARPVAANAGPPADRLGPAPALTTRRRDDRIASADDG